MNTAAESWGQGDYSSAFISLDEIAISTQTDKSSKGHNYTPEYERHFEPLRNEPIRLLEIGIDRGASLRMWSRYFTKGSIFGLDINEYKHAHSRCITIQGHQEDPELLRTVNKTYGPFNIVIDDGSHMNAHMQVSFDTLFPLLVPHGTYVIEDINCCFWNHTGRPVFDFGWLIRSLCRTEGPELKFDETVYGLVNDIKSLEFYKNILFICKK